jgi:superfamily II DNA or RNA helicase
MLELINNSSIDEQLRDYQLENKLKIYNLWIDNQSVMLQMPTGTGKTRLFASIVKDIHKLSIQNKKAYKVLILAHRQELIKQISENIGVRYGIAHGKIMSKNWEEDFYPTQVASVQTLTRRLDKWGDKKFDFIIIDEAHHALAPTYKKICKEFPDAKLLGVTATPYRMSKASFRTMFDELIISDSISEFIKKGYLSEYEYYSIKPNSKIQKLVDNINEFDIDGDYADKALSNTFDKDKIRANLLQTYYKYANGKKGIIYTINKSHNEHVCKIFVDAGINAKAIDSETKSEDRIKIVRDFKNGNIQILCNVNIFSEGFDCPDVEFIQLARPTKSLAMYLQQVGRGFRIHEEKEKVIFLDNVGLFNRFGLPSANRKWLKHFEGKIENEEEYQPQNLSTERVNYIEIDIEEGNEHIELIFSSDSVKDKIVDKNEFDRIEDFDLVVYENESLDLDDISKSDDYLLRSLLRRGGDEEYTMHDYFLCDFDEFYEKNTMFNKYTHLKIIENNGNVGLYDEKQSKIILQPIYDEIIPYNIFGELLIKINNKFGIYNPFKELIEIKPIYDEILNVLNRPNYNIVVLDNLYGIVSKSNKLTLEPFSNYIVEINNFFNVEFKEEWQLIDSNFTKINFNEFEVVEELEKFYIVKYNELFAISNGEVLVYPFLFTSYKIISNNIIIVNHKNYGCCVFNDNLDFIISDNYNSIELFKNKYLLVFKNGLKGLYDLNGVKILNEEYYDILLIDNNFIVRNKQFWKKIDLNGNELKSSNKKHLLLNKTKKQKQKKAEDDTVPKLPKVEDPVLKLLREKNESIALLVNIYDDFKTTYNNTDKSIRINKIKSEFKMSNGELESILKIVGINFFDNPNIKLTEAEYMYIKYYYDNQSNFKVLK